MQVPGYLKALRTAELSPAGGRLQNPVGGCHHAVIVGLALRPGWRCRGGPFHVLRQDGECLHTGVSWDRSGKVIFIPNGPGRLF